LKYTKVVVLGSGTDIQDGESGGMSTVFLILACGLGVFWFVARGEPVPRVRSRPILLRFLPLLAATAILLFYFLTEWGVFTLSRTEEMYGLFVVVLLPLAGMLLLLQLGLYLRILRERKASRRDPRH
jgi:hypothetical protein